MGYGPNDFLWKPSSAPNAVNPGGLSILLPKKNKYKGVEILGADDKVLDTLKYMPGDELGIKYYSSKPGGAYGNNLKVRVTLADGSTKLVPIGQGGARYQDDYDEGDFSTPQEGGGFGGGGFTPGSDPTGYGFYPADLSSLFPSPVLTDYSPIEAAPYRFTDPMAFAREYAPFARDQFMQNNALASEFMQEALRTELAALEEFVPQAASLKRRELSADNLFNQEERLMQIGRALPNARGDLNAQRERANAYARGRLPDDVEDAAFTRQLGSEAADFASSAGFGAGSGAARRTSQLMSARERYEMALRGEQLLGSNLQTEASLVLAPTQYSDAGAQVRVNPSVSPAELQTRLRGELNDRTGISAREALQTTVQQEQFSTNLEQDTRRFNASNTLQNDQFNARNQNDFALTKFDYQVAQAGAVAGAFQTGSNTALELQQQAAAQAIYQTMLQQAQTNQTIAAALQGIGAIFGGGSGGILGGISSVLGSLGSLLGLGDTSAIPATPDLEQPEFDAGIEDSPQPDLGVDTDLGEAPVSDTGELPSVGGEVNIDPNTGDVSIGETQFSSRLAATDGTGVAVPKSMQARALKQSDAVLNTAGVSTQKGFGRAAVGLNSTGKEVYSDPKLARSQDPNAGKAYQDALSGIIDPTGAFSREDATALDKIGAVASNVAFLGTLTDLAQRGDKKGFVNTILQKLKNPVIKAITDDPQTASGISAGFTAANLFLNWDRMSTAQKSIAVASLGLQAYRGATGTDLASMKIPGTGVNGTPGLTVGQTLGLASAGYNVYALIQNWDQYSDIQKVAAGAGTAAQLAQTAQSLGLLNNSVGVASAAEAGQIGAQSLGPGTLGYVGGGAAVALGAYQVYKGWGQGGERGAASGAIGGAGMAAGLYAMGATNPFLLGGVVAVSIAGNAIKTGKSEDQMARDSVRSRYKDVGLIDDKYQVTLANGSKADIGIDGRGGKHAVTNPGKLSKSVKNLNAWDLDYTNDLDYASGMAGIALSRLVSGGAGRAVDQLGNQLGNAGIADIGYGKEMTPENYARMVANQRAFFGKSGLANKKDAWALADQAFKEGRINATDLVTTQQALNMVYDDPKSSYQTAQKLMAGRHRGLEVAPESAQAGTEKKPEVKFPERPGTGLPASQAFNPRNPSTFTSEEEMKARNRRRYGRSSTEAYAN